jgi:hypothetical protein
LKYHDHQRQNDNTTSADDASGTHSGLAALVMMLRLRASPLIPIRSFGTVIGVPEMLRSAKDFVGVTATP